MTHIEVAHGLSPSQATAFEARLREARITYLKQEGSVAPCDPLSGPGQPAELEREPCVRYRVRRESADAARTILHRMLEENFAGAP
ncbi:MAG: hypothetical protein ISR76_07100 [Planctomycetes bacterium]|nr:hypothetical protein [Planctomycetota bacterium]MBL7008748.1 hypothetical protein [Planctomycetota bacterium]